VLQHGFACNVHQDFPWQPGRGHAGLDDGKSIYAHSKDIAMYK
jgi:hypothetical protein